MSDRDLYFRLMRILKDASEKDDYMDELINRLEGTCNMYMTQPSSQVRSFPSYREIFTIACEDFGRLE